MIIGNCVCVSFALGLENSVDQGNVVNQNQLRLVSLSSYLWNWYAMKMLAFAGNDLREFSLNVSLGLENCVGGKYE